MVRGSQTMSPPRSSSSRSWATAGLAAGSLVSGALAYAVFALSTRALGAEAAAPVAVLWSWWGFASAGLTFPVQHWITRTVAADDHEGGVRAAGGDLALLMVGVAGVTTGLAWLAREALFAGDVAFPVLVGLVSACAVGMGVVRGLLAARGRFIAVGGLLVAENGVRCAVALALMLTGVRSPTAYGVALVAGYLACLAWPGACRARRDSAAGPDQGARGARPPGPVGRFRAASFLASASGGQLLGQTVLTGGPVALAFLGGAPAAVTALFAGLALYRAPYTVVLGQVSQVTGALTRLVVRGDWVRLRRIEQLVLLLTALGLVLGAAVGVWVGPWAVRLVFGADVAVDQTVSVLLAIASVLALATLVQGVLLLAHARPQHTLVAWLLALLPAAGVLAFGPGAPEQTVAGAFLAAEATAWSVLSLSARSARRSMTGPLGPAAPRRPA